MAGTHPPLVAPEHRCDADAGSHVGPTPVFPVIVPKGIGQPLEMRLACSIRGESICRRTSFQSASCSKKQKK